MHGLSYGPALTRNTKERASVCQSDQVGLRPPRVTSHPILTRTIFSSACLLFRTVVPNIIVPWILLQNVDQLHFILLQIGTIITLWVQEKLTSQEKHCLSHLTIFFQDLDKGFFIYLVQDNKEHITNCRGTIHSVRLPHVSACPFLWVTGSMEYLFFVSKRIVASCLS